MSCKDEETSNQFLRSTSQTTNFHKFHFIWKHLNSGLLFSFKLLRICPSFYTCNDVVYKTYGSKFEIFKNFFYFKIFSCTNLHDHLFQLLSNCAKSGKNLFNTDIFVQNREYCSLWYIKRCFCLTINDMLIFFNHLARALMLFEITTVFDPPSRDSSNISAKF